MQKFFEIRSTAAYRSVTSTLKKGQKARLAWNFIDGETHFSAEEQSLNKWSCSQSKVFNFEWTDLSESHRFCSWHQKPESPKKAKQIGLDDDVSRYSNFYFYITWSLTSSIKDSTLVEKDSIETFFFWFFYQNPEAQINPKKNNSINLNRYSKSFFCITTVLF